MNVKPKFFKVMKQKFFTLIMMLALVIVTGSAFAQPIQTVYQGETYPYILGGIVVSTAGHAVITTTVAGASIENVEGSGVAYTGTDIPVASGSTFVLNFDVEYATVGTGTITVDVTDGGTGGCSNHISLAITVLARPTIDLAVAASEDQYCQATTNVTDNTAASVNSDNSFTFTVTPTIANDPAAYTFAYAIAFTDATGTFPTYDIVHTSGPGTWNEGPGTVTGCASETADVFTVTFKTVTMTTPIAISATVSSVILTETAHSKTFAETVTTNNDDHVDVNTTPSIGTFQ